MAWWRRLLSQPIARNILQLSYLAVAGALLGGAFHVFSYCVLSVNVFLYAFDVCSAEPQVALLFQVAGVALLLGIKLLFCRSCGTAFGNLAFERALLPLFLLLPVMLIPLCFWAIFAFILVLAVTFGRGVAAYEFRCLPSSSAGAARGHVLVVFAFIGVFVGYYTWVQYKAWDALLLNYADWAIYFNALDNTWSGKWFYANDIRRNYLGHHFMPGSFLLMSPVLLLARSEVAFFLFNTLVLAVGTLPLYLLGRAKKLPPICSLMLALAFLSHPSLSNMSLSMFYGFHPVYLAIPLIISFFWLRETNRGVAAGVVFALSLTINESVPVFWIFAGTFMVFTHSRRWGLAIAGTSLMYFALVVLILIPWIKGGGSYDFLARYSTLGGGYGEIAFSPIMRPSQFFGLLFRPQNLHLMAILLLPCLVLLLEAPLAGAALPFLALVFLQTSEQVSYLGVQYQSEALALIAVAAVYGLTGVVAGGRFPAVRAMACHMPELLRPDRSARAFASMALFGSLLCHLFFGLGGGSKNGVRLIELSPSLNKEIASLKQVIPERVTVLATPTLAAHFFLRNDVYLHCCDGVEAEYLLFDLKDAYLYNYDLKAEIARRSQKFRAYELLFVNGQVDGHEFVVFRKIPAPER